MGMSGKSMGMMPGMKVGSGLGGFNAMTGMGDQEGGRMYKKKSKKYFKKMKKSKGCSCHKK